jgi:Sec-independent protein translocase protein TatA
LGGKKVPMELLLIIVILLFLFGGFGFSRRGR